MHILQIKHSHPVTTRPQQLTSWPSRTKWTLSQKSCSVGQPVRELGFWNAFGAAWLFGGEWHECQFIESLNYHSFPKSPRQIPSIFSHGKCRALWWHGYDNHSPAAPQTTCHLSSRMRWLSCPVMAHYRCCLPQKHWMNSGRQLRRNTPDCPAGHENILWKQLRRWASRLSWREFHLREFRRRVKEGTMILPDQPLWNSYTP